MATTTQQTEAQRPTRGSGNGFGRGGGRDFGHEQSTVLAIHDHSSGPSKTGVWVALAAITMTFAAFTSALFVREGSSTDWRHFPLPRILYLNTFILVLSSATVEFARRRFRSDLSARGSAPAIRWLHFTLLLGFAFVAGQYIAWLQLRGEGLFLATNPSSSFFYVLTAVHALHVLGGLAGLAYVTRRLQRHHLQLGSLDAAGHYWHFMGALWLYVFFILWVKM